MYEDEMVDEELDTEADDTLPEGIEEDDESEDEEALESLEEEEEEQPAQEPQPSEPGWIRKRVDSAVQKALTRERESIRAEMEAQYAPIKERLLEMDAQDLVRRGVVKDIETAKELIRYRQGQPVVQEQQPRNENGQFAPKEDPATTARISMLAHQADTIRDKTGVDVLDVFMNDPDIKDAVISGDMDFYDVASVISEQQNKRRPPAPMRSPNGASGTNPNAIESMSDEQFERMEKRIREGARYTLR